VCHAVVEDNPGFVTWCSACDWNVSPSPQPKATRFQALEHRLADGMAERLVADVSARTESTTKSRPWLGVTANLLAAPVNLFTVGLAGVGVALVVLAAGWPMKLVGIFLLVLAFGARPRVGKRPTHSGLLTPESAPALFGLLTCVAQQTDAPLPDEVLINSSFNASAARIGLRRRALVIGAPLWQAAPLQSRVALIGHELGHFAHRDLTRTLWVGSALGTLDWWRSVFGEIKPGASERRFYRLWGGRSSADVRLVSIIVFTPIRAMITAYAHLILRVNAAAHRRQEYLADLDAISVAGSQGAIALFDTVLARKSVDAAITRSATRPDRPDVWQTVAAQMTATPAIEVERRRRAAVLERSRTDDSHPRTALRLRLVEQRPPGEPTVWCDAGTWQQIDRELAPAMAKAGRVVTDVVRYRC
jgi:Zn-dependent protease with chaperone function